MNFPVLKYGTDPVLSVTNWQITTANPAWPGVCVDLAAAPWQNAPALLLEARFTLYVNSSAAPNSTVSIFGAFSQNTFNNGQAIYVLGVRKFTFACALDDYNGGTNEPKREFISPRQLITGRYLYLWYNGGDVGNPVINFDVHAIPVD